MQTKSAGRFFKERGTLPIRVEQRVRVVSKSLCAEEARLGGPLLHVPFHVTCRGRPETGRWLPGLVGLATRRWTRGLE